MRLSLNGTDCEKLELELGSTGDGPLALVLQALRSVSGVVETGAGSGTRLRGFRATSAELQAGEWELAQLAIALGRQALLDRLNLQLDVAAAKEGGGVSGRASLGRADVGGATIALTSGPRVGFDLTGDGLVFERSPEGAGHLAADSVSLADAQFGAGGLLARIGSLSLEDARLDFGGQGLMFGSGAGQLERLAIEYDRVTIDIQQFHLPQGARTSGGTIVIPEIAIPDARMAIDDLTELIRERMAERKPPAEPAANPNNDDVADRPARPPPTVRLTNLSELEDFDEPQYAFLDRVSGRLEVDLTMALTIPVIGRRLATHHFRIPIVNGVINYRDLERDLADLEDAFIDVEVRGKALVIERKIPIIGLERPLVIWDLDEEELDLAKRRLVRLRTVPKLRMAARDSKAVVKVRQLDFDHIELSLEMAPPAEDSSTDNTPTGQASIGQARFTGSISHHTSRPRTEPLPATEVSLNAEKIVLGPFKIPLGASRRLDIDRIEIAEISPGKVVFDGVYPRTSSVAVRGIRLHGVRIRETGA